MYICARYDARACTRVAHVRAARYSSRVYILLNALQERRRVKEEDGGERESRERETAIGDGEDEKERKTVGESEKGRNGSRRHSRNYGLRLRLDTSLE